jgi:hypothetical protein
VGTLTRSIALFAAGLWLAPLPVSGQSYVSVAFETGPLFTGIGVSTGSYYSSSSVFVGASLGTYYGTHYGIYSPAYDYGRRAHVRGHAQLLGPVLGQLLGPVRRMVCRLRGDSPLRIQLLQGQELAASLGRLGRTHGLPEPPVRVRPRPLRRALGTVLGL